MIEHYISDSHPNTNWISLMREIESEGERTPIQTDPPADVMDIYTPALLRRQAA